MQIKITGCPDKKFKPYVQRAVEYYGQELISKKIYKNINLRVKFDNKIPAWGFASIEDYNTQKKPRGFLLEIHPGIGAKHILETLAHEMVHINQYILGDLNGSGDVWRGLIIDSSTTDYYMLPWEIEAYGREVGLFANFAIKERLWDIFEGIYNPNDPIENSELGWKQ